MQGVSECKLAGFVLGTGRLLYHHTTTVLAWGIFSVRDGWVHCMTA